MATMKAVRIHEFGDVDVLKYEDVERPELQADEVLVRVRAAGINPVDCGSRSGGAGGVGHYAIQLAKAKGAQVITTTSIVINLFDRKDHRS